GVAEVDQGVQQGGGADPVLAGGGQVGQQHGGEGAAQAEPDDVHLLAPGDVGDDVERFQRAPEQVVVEGDVAHRLVGVPVADGEHRVAVGDGPLHEAAARRQVHDVVL